jgi:hypothetical protein
MFFLGGGGVSSKNKKLEGLGNKEGGPDTVFSEPV